MGSARRFTTTRFAVTSGPKSARMYPRKNALRFKRGSVTLWRKKNARLFQGQSALKSPTGSVAAFLNKSALMFQSSSVSRCQRLNARTSTDSRALRFQYRIVNRSPDVFVHWFPPSRSVTVSAPLIRGMSVNQSPSRFAMMSTNLVKCVMMYQRKSVTMSPPLLPSTWTMSSVLMSVQGSVLLQLGKSVPMLLSRFQDRHSRLNVKLNTPRSVASPVVDMETKNSSSFGRNMYDLINVDSNLI